MKKVILSLFIVIVCIGFACFVFTAPVDAENNRFVEVSTDSFSNNDLKIFYDKKTKVMYLVTSKLEGTGVTVMLDTEGKPLLYKGE